MRLIEGWDIRAQDLSKMEEVAATTPIEHIDRNFRDIVLILRSSSRNDSLRQGHNFKQYFQRFSQSYAAYVCTDCVLIFSHITCGWRWELCLFVSLFTVASSTLFLMFR